MIVIQRVDRAARNVRELVATFDRLRRCGVELASIAADVDTSTAAGVPIFRIVASIGSSSGPWPAPAPGELWSAR
jgi:DNA invertase Pin-like site-specific DNA recombinase